MACQLQPECNFMHGYFQCKLLVEVVDVEVKIMSMLGTHLYKRDQTMQVTKCLPWTNNIRPHPTIVKKMKTFLEVENKMGTMIQSSMPSNQTRPPLPITNPNVIRPDNAERRRTIMPKRKFRPVNAANPPVSQVPPKPDYKIPPAAARASTPWPGAGKTAGNKTDDRQWLLLKAIQPYRTRTMTMTFPPQRRMLEQKHQ